ncbi:MAG: hypothetical protein ACRCX2_13570 [Paraclostridium sp.]
MARVITKGVDSPNIVNRRKEYSGVKKGNRAEQEHNIATNAKGYLDSFFTTLNDAPSMLGTYYSTNIGETTFSENLNNQKRISKATKFNKIEKFVIWGQKNSDEIEKKDDEGRENALQVTDQECIILQGTIRPLVGDHFVFMSQGDLAIPYMVTDIKPVKFIDKPVYSITLSVSNTFDIDTLEQSVVETYTFVFGNVGTQRKTLLRKNIFTRLGTINKLLIELNDMYVDAFYDDKYDILRFNSNALSSMFVSCKALREFQNSEAVLTWGSDLNTLFVNYPFITKRDTVDYKKSYIAKIMKRKLSKKEDIDTNGTDHLNLSSSFKIDYDIRDKINEDNYFMLDDDLLNLVEDYNSIHDFSFKLYSNVRTDFSILTNFRNSNIILHEFNSISASVTSDQLESFYIYECRSNIFKYIIDLWINEDYDGILNCRLLDEYIVSNNNIDDYMMMPIVLWIIGKTMDIAENDNMTTSF